MKIHSQINFVLRRNDKFIESKSVIDSSDMEFLYILKYDIMNAVIDKAIKDSIGDYTEKFDVAIESNRNTGYLDIKVHVGCKEINVDTSLIKLFYKLNDTADDNIFEAVFNKPSNSFVGSISTDIGYYKT